MDYALCLGLLAPLFGFLLLMATSSVLPRRLIHLIGCATIFLSFVCFSTLLVLYMDKEMSPLSITLFSWIPIQGIDADFSLLLDPLSLQMTLIITGIGFLIHVYSIGYMEDEEDLARYFACLNFFVFAMLLLVLAGHLLVLFVGWEGVGLASYLLIGFWYQRPEAARAATKAFVVNRIGDLGFLLGLLLTFHTFGTGNIAEITRQAGEQFAVGAPVITLITLLYFIGATGKSAQIPLHIWLPDAMAGPTPVSALIHAATMVTAGVYLIVRMHEVFLLAPFTLQVVGVVGGFTSLFASLCAVGQTDLKRVLAFSTVSQLGLMFLACGAGAFYSAMFHLTTHAFMKALLFLSAGNVVHMMHDETEMGKMGGMSKIFSKTHWLFLVGAVAMSGIPPLAAFFSKDMILEQEYLSGFEFLYFVGLAASVLTGFYLIRAYCLTFFGESHVDRHVLKFVKEAPPVMIVPAAILAIFSIGGGALGFEYAHIPPLEILLGKVIHITPLEKKLSTELILTPEMWMAIGGAFGGVGLAALLYAWLVKHLGNNIALFRKSFYIDEMYGNFIVVPIKAVAKIIADTIEPRIFDGSISLISQGTDRVAQLMQRMQSGQIRSYAAWIVFGTAFIIAYFVF